MQSPFQMCDDFIENAYFIEDGVLLLMTYSLEFKLFHTENLQKGVYNREKSKQNLLNDPELEKRQHLCQIDGAIFANSISQTLQGPLYNQTLKAHSGYIVGLNPFGVSQYAHVRWDESLHSYRSLVGDNWVQLFARAIDIYTGRVKGFRDVSEEEYLREQGMKDELKLLISSII